MEDANKPLDALEKSVYKKRTHQFLGSLIGVAVLFGAIYPVISTSVIVAVLCVAVMLVVG